MKISEAVIGKWPAILTQLGIDESFLNGKHGPCPSCGGKDRWRFDDKDGKGTYYCTNCGSGGGFKLLELVFGWPFPTAAKKVEEVIGNCSDYKPRPRNKPDPKIRLKKIAEKARPLSVHDEVFRYLKNRGINESTFSAISNKVKVVNDGYWENRQLVAKFDCMAALVTHKGKPLTYHLTYLENGKKADVLSPRKILTPVQSITGGAVELFEFTDELGVAEGIETALSAYQLFKVPVWAVLNTTGMKGFDIPEGVKKLWVFGDNDESSSFAGQGAAYELAHRAKVKGVSVEVKIPAQAGFDWNDELMTRIYEQH